MCFLKMKLLCVQEGVHLYVYSYIYFFNECRVFWCVVAAYVCFIVTALGVTAGAHRLWSHRSYRAKLPLRVFLAAANSMAFQVSSCPPSLSLPPNC